MARKTKASRQNKTETKAQSQTETEAKEGQVLPMKTEVEEKKEARGESFTLTEAIKRDHEDLRKSIEILKSEDKAHQEKKKAYNAFSKLLKSHTTSEEKTLYKAFLKEKEFVQKGHEGHVEHEVAKRLMKQLEGSQKKEEWLARAKVLAEVVEHHLKEEEEKFLPQFDERFSEEQKDQLLRQFMEQRARTQTGGKKDKAGVLAA